MSEKVKWPPCPKPVPGTGLNSDLGVTGLPRRSEAPTTDTDGLVERLRRTELRAHSYSTNRSAPPINEQHNALINPDGPEAADRIQSDVKRIAELEGKLAQREEQLAMISASWSNHNAAMMVKLNELAATIEATLGAKP